MSTVVPSTDFVGSWLLGYVQEATYADLVNIFGEPHDVGDGYKVDAEWRLLVDGEYATIYNYKSGLNYDSEEGRPVEELKDDDWHIGGTDSAVTQKLNEYIAERKSDESSDIPDALVDKVANVIWPLKNLSTDEARDELRETARQVIRALRNPEG